MNKTCPLLSIAASSPTQCIGADCAWAVKPCNVNDGGCDGVCCALSVIMEIMTEGIQKPPKAPKQ